MGLLHPELLLLLVPGGYVWWRTRGSSWPTLVIRLIVLVLVVLAIAEPYVRTASSGRDLVIVVDRSRSMPSEARDSALELAGLAEEARAAGDRVGVVTFGSDVHIERLPSATEELKSLESPVSVDGSNIGEALQTALNLIPEGRQGSILLLSDGENNGRDPLEVARRCFARGVRIDVRPFRRPGVSDLSVDRIALPDQVAVGEPFQFAVWVRSDGRVDAEFILSRRGNVISKGRRIFEQGLNRLVFRDRLERGGVADYRIELLREDDRVPENNRGLGAVLVQGPRTVLLLNTDGAEDSLSAVLREAKIPVVVAQPEDVPLDVLSLTTYRAVILENVPAVRLGAGTAALRDFVLERGGGLLMTGGRASFGVGG